jgi:hypothetical protein
LAAAAVAAMLSFAKMGKTRWQYLRSGMHASIQQQMFFIQ